MLTFLSLPLELRNIIYGLTLRSSTGLVIYKQNLYSIREHYGRNKDFTLYAASAPSSLHYDPLPNEVITVNLLYTCRQIRDEAKNMLWAQNVLIFSASDLPHLSQQLRIQHILLQYRLDEDDRRQPAPLQRTIDILGRWAQEGNLKSITMRTREPLRHPYDSRQHVERNIEGHLARWREATRVNGSLANVFRMAIFTGVNLWALRNSCRPICPLDDLLKELHVAMGCEIWTEGRLCWKEGVHVAKAWSAFEWVPSERVPPALYPRILPAVQREIDGLPNEYEVYGSTR
jgi:hypothetical protein